ncbi:neurofilament medium polypeptide-like [Camellia sinensis]|uniref:neurofilament medium polypeptide-like n=1 Tax=Camellia sinensis TaxID=4442 RepID=UPI00103579C5|nr:neurofilament medium polypeptide-like [Camellia sinensis]
MGEQEEGCSEEEEEDEGGGESRRACLEEEEGSVAGRLEGEEGPARVGTDRLVGIVEEAALRSTARFNEAELLRGLCPAQMEVTTLAGALLRKAGAAKLKAEEAKTQLAKLKKKSAKALSSNEELVRQKDEADVKIGDLKKELEGKRAKAVKEMGRLQKELAVERAKATAEKKSLEKELEEERAKVASERAALQRELDEERAKAASERAAYPDLCIAAVEQFKGFAEFQMAIDAAVASSLARQESGGPHRGRPLEAERKQKLLRL